MSLGVDFFLAQPLGSHYDSRDVVHQVPQALIVGERDATELLRVTVDMRRFQTRQSVEEAQSVGEQDAFSIFLNLHKEAHIVLVEEELVQVRVHVFAVVYVHPIAILLQEAHEFDLLRCQSGSTRPNEEVGIRVLRVRRLCRLLVLGFDPEDGFGDLAAVESYTDARWKILL